MLSPREAADEALVMGLRLAEGIDVGALEERFGVGVVDRRSVRELTDSGFLAASADRLAVTPQGRLVLDHLLARLAV